MVNVVVAASLWSLSICAFALPPDSFKPLAIGAVTGFVSDTPDARMCGMSIMTEGTALAYAVRDMTRGITTLNLTEIADSLHELVDALDQKSTMKTCTVLVVDVKTIAEKLRQIHGAKDLLVHILGNTLNGGEKIFAQLAAAEKAYKSGRDYLTAGQNLGMALRRMLIGALDGTAPLALSGPSMPKNARAPLLMGIAEGFVSDSPDLMACGMTVAGEVAALKDGLKDLMNSIANRNVTEIEGAIQEVVAAVGNRGAFRKQCDIVVSDLKLILGAFKQMHGAKDLISHIMTNFLADGGNIFGELASAEQAYKTGWDYMGAGQHLGMAFRRMLVGELNSPNITVATEMVIV